MKTYFRLKYLNKHNTIYNKKFNNELECNTGNTFQKMSLCGGCFKKSGLSVKKVNAIIPLPFSFTKDVGKSIPVFLIDSKNGYDSSLTLNYKNDKLESINDIKISLLLKVASITEEEKKDLKIHLMNI